MHDIDIEEKISFDSFQKRMKYGDILFASGPYLANYMKRIFTNSPLAHVMMVYDHDEIFHVIPTSFYNIKNMNDVHIVSLKKYLKSGLIDRLYYLPIKRRFNKKYNKKFNIDEYINYKYSYNTSEFIQAWIPNEINVDDIDKYPSEIICSALIAKIIKENIHSGFNTP